MALSVMHVLARKNGTETEIGLSMSKTQSTEWRGPLPKGHAADNHTMSIIGMWGVLLGLYITARRQDQQATRSFHCSTGVQREVD